jgi:hypothetical protein
MYRKTEQMQITKISHLQSIMKKFSIKKGYDQLQMMHVEDAKRKLWEALEIKSRSQWSSYMRGLTEPKISQALAAQAVFAQYGIIDLYEEE